MAHVRIRPSFRSLPPELIEEIIITSTLLGDTRAAATLARTCRWFRVLVYHQMHKHLWRELFLVVFDDPRPGRTVRTRGGAPWSPQIDLDNKGKVKIKNRLAAHDFPWEHEYKLRIWTESFILRRTRPPPPGSPSPSPSFPPDLPCTDDDIYTVLETLLRVILTAAPLPYDTLACMASHFQTCSPPHPHPIFSPLFVAAHAHQALVMSSRNTTWLAHVLAHGLPRILMARLTALDENGNVDVQKVSVKWDGLLAKFVAQVGLMTPFNNSAAEPPHDPELISPLTADADADGCGSVSCGLEKSTSVIEDEGGGDGDCDELETYHSGVQDAGDLSSDDDDSDFVPQPEDGSTSESDEERISDIDGDEVLGTTATPATTPQDGVRRLARVRVYNMAYLRPSRAFGPFLPLNTHDASSSPATPNPGSSTLEREDTTRSPSIVVPPVPAIPDTNFFLRALAGAVDGSDFDGNESLLFFDDDSENNYHGEGDDGDVDGSSSSSSVRGGNASTSSPPSAIAATTSYGGRRMSGAEIPGDQLRFDWAWIAAARQVIELNLRDLLTRRHQGVLRALLSLDGLRPCSSPGFPPVTAEVVAGEPVFKDGDGWDWAGVEGQWRRCVCWLDYRDLLGNNAQPLEKRLCNPALYEVMRIIPLTLRITHYSRAPPQWPGRPMIHVAGDWHTTATPPDLARVRGTVEMVSSGDIRWTLISFREDGQGQWSSEGVQLGGLGSAMGVIGMWTGAEHELSDPLGPFWAWKVGPLNDDAAMAMGDRRAPGARDGNRGAGKVS